MLLSFTFYKKQKEDNIQPDEEELKCSQLKGKDKIIYLHNDLTNNKIWQNRDFWETTIIEMIYENLNKNKNELKSVQPTIEMIQKEKHIILTILT